MRKKLLAVDGNSILNRAFYGIRPLTTKDGFFTNALYGMVTMLGRQVDKLSPDCCAIAFDLKAPTFRHRMYDAYKAGRRAMPEELAMQLPVAKELARALGFTVLEAEGYEADDILGTLAQMCSEADCCAYLMTGDRDALQLIGPDVKVLLATNSDTVEMDENAFFEKYGVRAEQFVDVKALMGDSSDNIPGVPGVGEKTALRLISEFGSLDGVYGALPTAKHTPSLRAKLEAGKDSAYLSQSLARICRQVPLGVPLSALETHGIDRAAAKKLFLQLEFSAFMKRFRLDEEVPAEPVCAPEVSSVSATAEGLSEVLKTLSEVALDYSEDAITLSDGKHVYRYDGTAESLAALLRGKKTVVYDAKTFFKLPQWGALFDCDMFDLMLGAYLVNSAKPDFGFATLLSDYLSLCLPENTPRAAYFLPLYRELRQRLEDSGQTALMDTVEMPLCRVLADMERTGFCIDREGIRAYGEQLGAVAEGLEAQIYEQAGKRFNINSPKQLGEVLFDTLGLPHAKKTKTGYSTNAEILEKLRPYHPIIEAVLDYRQVTKLKSTYADGLLKVADANGRVHTNFKQTGTATGRLSSTEPNLQNIPIRTELGRELRRFFLPQSGEYVLIDADYSQIELRVLAHISGDANMLRSFSEGMDIHTSTAATVFGVAPEQVTSEMRKKAKAVNFGILYGIGAFSLSDDIGTSRAQAQEYIDQYLESYPGIDAYLKDVIAKGYENGYVTTMLGRRRYIPELAGTNKVQKKFGERVAMNSPIQGTAADIIKLAMIRVHKRLSESGMDARLILQVHDELLIEAHRNCAEQAKVLLKEEMEHAVQCAVPLEVDVHIGENWYEAK